MQKAPPPPTRVIELADVVPLATGSQRRVYAYPGHPDFLIKVMREDALGRRFGPDAPWHKRRSRLRDYVSFARELKEYIGAMARRREGRPPVARLLGLVETDLGLGLVSELVRDADGQPAPTLARLYQDQEGLAPATERALDDFVEDMLRYEIIVGDLHAWNLIYGSDSRGGPRFVMIDGFGEKNIVPLASMSRAFNRHRTLRRYARMREQLGALVPVGGD